MVTRQVHGAAHRFSDEGETSDRRGRLAAAVADGVLDGIPAGWGRALLLLPVVVTLLLGVAYAVRPRLYYWLMLEDHPVEWAEFGLMVFASLAFTATVTRLARQRRYGTALLLALIAVGCIGLAGEEISWGERVFNLAVPTELAANNAQNELNLHNQAVGGVAFNTVSDVVEFLLGLGGCLVALLACSRRGPGTSAWIGGTWIRSVTPPLVTVPGFVLPMLYQVIRHGTGFGMIMATVLLYQECAEFCLYLAIAVTAVCCYARAVGSAPIAPTGTAAAPCTPGSRPRLGHVPLVVSLVVAACLTGTFAVITSRSRILPGNIPPSLIDLYTGKTSPFSK
jgi:hypothetical protein